MKKSYFVLFLLLYITFNCNPLIAEIMPQVSKNVATVTQEKSAIDDKKMLKVHKLEERILKQKEKLTKIADKQKELVLKQKETKEKILSLESELKKLKQK